MKKKLQRMIALFLMFSVIAYTISNCFVKTNGCAKEQNKKEYIIITESNDTMTDILEEYNGTMIQRKDKKASNQSIAVSTMSEQEADKLEKQEKVLAVEPDVNVKANQIKNGRKMIKKKMKKNVSWNAEMINQHEYNGEKKNTNEKVKVAILDSGVDYANDIKIEKSINLVSDGEVSPLFIDITGHGSSVAGVIAAKDNEEGITGINPDVLLYSAKVLDNDNMAPISRVVEGIYWAIEQDVDIINISFGTTTNSLALERAIKDAYDNGILIVAAAGNTGAKVEYPAAYDQVLSVGSVSSNGEVSSFSAQGDKLDIVAPGEKIESTGGFGGTVVCSGTSMAAPHVVGVASLIWQKDKSVTNDFVRMLLNASANSYGDKNLYGNGLLDEARAFEIYDEFKQIYEKKGNSNEIINDVEENTSNVAVFDTSAYVEGSWKYEKHNDAIQNSDLSAMDISILKTGATYPDADASGVKGLGKYPEWHGGYKSDNYIGSYIYVTNLARAMQYDINMRTVYAPGDIGSTEKSHLYNAVVNVNWEQMLATPSTHNKILFIWGMAIHTATDVYAHSAWANVYCKKENITKWEHLDHDEHNGKADEEDVKPNRYETAARVARKSIKKYVQGKDGSVDDFLPEGGYKNAGANWKIKGLSDNARKLGCGTRIFDQLYQYSEAPIYHSYYNSNK